VKTSINKNFLIDLSHTDPSNEKNLSKYFKSDKTDEKQEFNIFKDDQDDKDDTVIHKKENSAFSLSELLNESDNQEGDLAKLDWYLKEIGKKSQKFRESLSPQKVFYSTINE